MNTQFPSRTNGIADAIGNRMNTALQAKLARTFAREFYRRGRLTWDMKMALRLALIRSGQDAPASKTVL